MTKQAEMWLALPRAAGDYAGVFEHDGRVGYFYLYEVNGPEGRKVRCALRVVGDDQGLHDGEVGLLWDGEERMVGVMIRGQLCAAFDSSTGEKFGGEFAPSGSGTGLPQWVREAFDA